MWTYWWCTWKQNLRVTVLWKIKCAIFSVCAVDLYCETALTTVSTQMVFLVYSHDDDHHIDYLTLSPQCLASSLSLFTNHWEILTVSVDGHQAKYKVAICNTSAEECTHNYTGCATENDIIFCGCISCHDPHLYRKRQHVEIRVVELLWWYWLFSLPCVWLLNKLH